MGGQNKMEVNLEKKPSERRQTNKYGRGTERHLPKTDESILRPAGERR